ncbi:peroxiredoxin-2E-2, chloroplastic-like [Coffea arabica]|uniref:Glutaredoxin-dependent peroxiredoxin n=1 Tax=Coffea arabica TaxID=13443 RepID=A0ABM4UM80_COFAR|nr:peroxiredoxin-2E-2, chloroplastic [Coffea arabica]
MAAATTTFTLTKLLSSTPKPLTPLLSSKPLSSFSSSFAVSRLPLKLHHPLHLPKPFLRFSSTQTKISATISVGDKLPDASLSYLDASNDVQTVSISDLTANKKAILFAVPGAFTPTCSQKHVPGFVEKASEFKSKGVDTIACIAVNDAFVMKAWKENLNITGDDVLLLSDGNGVFTKAMGVELDLTDKPMGLGVRSRRYAMLVEDGVVKVLNLEEGGAFNVSSAEDMLKVL